MSLKPSHRSRSAPQSLPSLKDHPSAHIDDPSVPDAVTSQSSRTNAQDPFSLDGFFPRTKSYYEINRLEQWDCQWARPEEKLDIDNERAGIDSSLTNSGASMPSTPSTTLVLLVPADLDDVARDIDQEDRMGVLSFSSTNIIAPMKGSDKRQTFTPTYEHDHLFHSYDNLHSSFCERRRSATVPNLAAYYSTGNTKTPGDRRNYDNFADGSDTGRTLSLFSPEEEALDLSAAGAISRVHNEGHDEVPSEGWSQFVWDKAKKLWALGEPLNGVADGGS